MASVSSVSGAMPSSPIDEHNLEEAPFKNSIAKQPESSVEPVASSWTDWFLNPFASKPKEPVKQFVDEPVKELKKLWVDVYRALAELEYEVMQLRARVGAYEAVDPTFSDNRELMQQLGVMRPNVIKAKTHLLEMEHKLENLRAFVEQGRVYFIQVLEIEKKGYEREFFERAIGRIGLEGNLESSDVMRFLKTCRQKQKELIEEVGLMKSRLGACPLLLKA